PRLHAAAAAGAAELAPLPAPPSGLCIPAALSPQGRAHLNEFLAWWRGHGPDNAPALLDLAGDTPAGDAARPAAPHRHPSPAARQAALYRHLSRVAFQEATATARRETELTGQLYEMRLEQEQGRVALEAMQDRLCQLEKVPCHLAFQAVPGGATYRPEGAGALR